MAQPWPCPAFTHFRFGFAFSTFSSWWTTNAASGFILEHLRKRALSALRLRKAGVNPLFRLTLSKPESEPKLWRAKQVLLALHRLALKEPRFLTL